MSAYEMMLLGVALLMLSALMLMLAVLVIVWSKQEAKQVKVEGNDGND